MNKLKLTYENMLSYLKNVFSNNERYLLEKQVMQDPFEAEAFEGLSELSAKEFEADIQRMQNQIIDNTQNRKVLFWKRPMTIAASVLVLFGLGVFFLTRDSKEVPYNIVDATKENKDAVVVTEKESFSEPDFSNKVEAEIVFEEVEDLEEFEKESEAVMNKPDFSRKVESPRIVKESVVVNEPIVNSDIERVKEIEENKIEEETVFSEVEIEGEDSETWSGVVTNSYGEPLPGVSIIIKDSNIGVVSDFDGKYVLEAPKDAVFKAEFLGFETTEFLFDKSKKVILEEDLASLDEVVVVGYGTQKKKQVSGAVAKVSADKLSEKSASRVDEALSGRVTGVAISEPNEAEPNGQKIKPAIAPQGNDSLFKRWFMTQLDPSIFEKGKQYSITVDFEINSEGKVTNIKIPADLDLTVKEHLEKVMFSGLNWSPAENENGTIKESKKLVLWFHF